MPISRQINGALQDSQTWLTLHKGPVMTHSIHDNENRWSADLKESPNTMFDSEQQVIYSSSVRWRLAADWSSSNVGAQHSSRSLQTPGDPRWCWDRTSKLQLRFCNNTPAVSLTHHPAVKVSLRCSNGVKWKCIWKQMAGNTLKPHKIPPNNQVSDSFNLLSPQTGENTEMQQHSSETKILESSHLYKVKT